MTELYWDGAYLIILFFMLIWIEYAARRRGIIKIEVSQEQGRVPVTVFSIAGNISAENYEQLEQQGRDAVKSGTRDLLLDLTAVDFVSSSGLRAFHSLHSLLHADAPNGQVGRGIRSGTYEAPHLKLLNPNSHVLNTLKLTGFDMILGVYTDRQVAVNAF